MARPIEQVPTTPQEPVSVPAPAVPGPLKRRRSSQAKPPGRRASASSDAPLACLSCRQRKVKCQPGPAGCTRCLKLQIQCIEPEADERKRPSSKTHIRELYERISYLEEELRKARSEQPAASEPKQTDLQSGVAIETSPRSERSYDTAVDHVGSEKALRSTDSAAKLKSESLIARLSGSRWQLNSDEEGRLHFYGPTSSLHLTENISSSILQEGDHTSGTDYRQYDVAPELQAYLLELYWKYQNPILQVVHKESFLHDLAKGQRKYYSTLLLYCIFACSARISDRQDIRALSVMQDDDLEAEQPYFIKKATELLEEELKRPQITTVQSLQLLSVLDCARSNDTKGWMFTGDACRLAFDLGLHRDCSDLQVPNGFSQMDLEARSVTFWGCFVFDRLWAMYLGRPHAIKLNDVTVPRPGDGANQRSSWDMIMATAWADLLELVGNICDALNGNYLTSERIAVHNKRLTNWHSKLDTSLRPSAQTPPAVYVLHMQYNSALILLNRPLAGFGAQKQSTKTKDTGIWTAEARRTCVQNAMAMTELLQGYEKAHGDAFTMSGVALHPISTASTVLISEIVDRKGLSANPTDAALTSQHIRSLKRCIKSLSEMEKSYPVTRRVRKIIQLIMRLSNVSDGVLPKPTQGQDFELPPQTPEPSGVQQSSNMTDVAAAAPAMETPQQQQQQQQQQPQNYNFSDVNGFNEQYPDMSLQPYDVMMPNMAAWDTSWSPHDLSSIGEITPMTSQMDILYSFESFFGNEYGGL